MVKLSRRMEAVASMVTPGNRVCDVGCDHGYVSIFLVQSGKAPSAIAMDLREGPLAHARENICENELSDKIETRISDGVCGLSVGEADTVIIAGMGGELVLHILKDSPDIFRSVKEFILQPQSEIHKVRKYLRKHNFEIVEEDMILEEGKFYPMFRVIPVEECSWDHLLPTTKKVCDMYGPLLLRDGNVTLRKYLVKENKNLESLKKKLQSQDKTDSVAERLLEVEISLKMNEAAYSAMGEIKKCRSIR